MQKHQQKDRIIGGHTEGAWGAGASYFQRMLNERTKLTNKFKVSPFVRLTIL